MSTTNRDAREEAILSLVARYASEHMAMHDAVCGTGAGITAAQKRNATMREIEDAIVALAAPPTPAQPAAPAQSVPLTSYEIERFWLMRSDLHDGALMPQLHDFARAIERAHGIGGQHGE